jgi:hypothetical protein
MTGELLFQWNYLLFLAPMAVAALMLVLSTIRFGGHGGAAHARHGAGGGHGHHSGGTGTHAGHHGMRGGHGGSYARAHGGSHARHGHHVRHAAKHGSKNHAKHSGNHVRAESSLGVMLMALRRAPLTMKLQTFFVGWGLGGFWANWVLLRAAKPAPPQFLPILGIAVGGGLLASLVLAGVFALIMPQEESFDVSRDSLYGMTGRIIFSTDEMQGRIRIYDSHGTLHDEPCLTPAGHPAIPKGGNAMVMDRDSKGRLIVEQVG